MKHKVTLRFNQDDANGQWGLVPDNAIHCSNPFNSFWHSIGIFHDVFEHWFEEKHKYFLGDNSFNVGGEVAAMGAYYYFAQTMCFSPRCYIRGQWIGDDKNIIGTTNSEILEAIYAGYTNFGSTLNCGVPYQKDEYHFECLNKMAEKQYEEVLKCETRTSEEEEKERAIEYKKSVKLWKLQRLYRWGYKQAEKLVPNNGSNYNALQEFWDNCEELVKHDAEELSFNFSGLTVTVTKKKGYIKITAWLIKREGGKVKLKTYINNPEIIYSDINF